jgi:hypothetical protein
VFREWNGINEGKFCFSLPKCNEVKRLNTLFSTSAIQPINALFFYCTVEMGGGVLWQIEWVRLGKKYGF